jgi:hypothetical protein
MKGRDADEPDALTLNGVELMGVLPERGAFFARLGTPEEGVWGRIEAEDSDDPPSDWAFAAAFTLPESETAKVVVGVPPPLHANPCWNQTSMEAKLAASLPDIGGQNDSALAFTWISPVVEFTPFP